MALSIDDYAASFGEEPGYLDFARVGPVGRTVKDEQYALAGLLGRARFGTIDSLHEQDARVRDAVAALIGFRPDQVAFQSNTSQALTQAVFGLSGEIAMAASEFPSLPFAAVRAREAMGLPTASAALREAYEGLPNVTIRRNLGGHSLATIRHALGIA